MLSQYIALDGDRKLLTLGELQGDIQMDTQEIVRQLEEQRDRLNVAIAALNGQPRRYKARRATARSKMSPEARERISRAQKARWAAQKKK